MSAEPGSIKSFVQDLNAKLKSKVLFTGDEEVSSTITGWVHTGCDILDWCIGEGVPLGRCMEIFGPESIGKSTLALHILAENQRQGGLSVIIDSESTLDIERGVSFGLVKEDLMVLDASTVEEGFFRISYFMGLLDSYESMRNRPIVIVWDTIASAPVSSDMDSKDFAGGMMHKPRIIRTKLSTVAKNLGRRKISLIFINQEIDGPGGPSSGGGRGVKFYSSSRLHMQKSPKGSIDEGGAPVGIYTDVHLIKNKIQRPLLVATLPIKFVGGIDNELCNYNFLKDTGSSIAGSAGAWSYFMHPTKGKLSFYPKEFHKKLISQHADVPGLLRAAARIDY